MTDATAGITNETGAGTLLVDVTQLTVNGQVVVRQRFVLADPANAEQFANVTPAGALQVDGSAVTQPVSQAAPSVGAANFAPSQVVLNGTTPRLLAAARTGAPGVGRVSITVQNTAGVTIYLGGSAVTASTGLPLLAGESVTIPIACALYAVLAAAGTPTVGTYEIY